MEKLRHRVKLREIAYQLHPGAEQTELGKVHLIIEYPRSFLVLSPMFEFIENVSVLLLICLSAVNLNKYMC